MRVYIKSLVNPSRWGFPKGENRDSLPLVQAKALLLRSIKSIKAVPAFLAGTALKSLFISLLLFTTTPYAASDFWPTAAEWRQSFRDAAYSPFTWVPLAGAAVIFASATDTRISNWAYENTPVFGNPKNAGQQSTNLERALGLMAMGSLLLVPQRDEDKSWLLEKSEYFLVMTGAYGASVGVTGALKVIVGRPRPNGNDTRSFPSGHMTSAMASSAIISRNLDSFNISRTTNVIAKTGVYILAAGVGWGRVESYAHYPVDVLVGAAIGNFFTSAIYNAFMNKPVNDRIHVSVLPAEKGFYFSLDKEFN